MPVNTFQLLEGVPPLGTYYAYLTGGCNLACRHCWLSPKFQPDGGTGGHLDYRLLKLAIDQALPLGLSHVKLTGGEPLLHPHFVRIVDLLREKELSLTIETNGTLLTQSLARYLKDKSTLGQISVSLDGATPETHDAFRGVKGSFESTCNGIRHLVNVGYRPQVIMSLHTGNVNEAEALVRLVEKLGAGSVKLGTVQPTGRGERMVHQDQVLDLHRLVELGVWVDTYLQQQVSIPLYYHWPMAFFRLNKLVHHGGCSCNILNILGILSTGQLAMCGIGVHIPELCYGLLGQDHIRDVWMDHPVLIDLRKSLPNKLEGICGECLLRNRCLGGCVAENYHLARRLTAPFWFCQRAYEAGLFPSSRRR